MPNHFHFLSKAKPITAAIKSQIETEGTKRGLAFLAGEVPASTFYESQFASFFKSYAQSINKQEERRFGSLFKAKFRRTLVRNKSDFLHFLCYIHHNPIHHHMAVNYLDWEFCSYSRYFSDSSLVQLSDTLKVSDNSASIPKLAISSTLKLFKSTEDKTGLIGFKAEHEAFKKFRLD